MQIVIKYTESDGRMLTYLLQKHYNTKKKDLAKLVKAAAWKVAAEQAKKEADNAATDAHDAVEAYMRLETQ